MCKLYKYFSIKITLALLFLLQTVLLFAIEANNIYLAPNSSFFSINQVYASNEINKIVEICLTEEFDESLITTYTKLIATGGKLLSGYSMYPSKNGSINFLSKKGDLVLQQFLEIQESIQNDNIDWKSNFPHLKDLFTMIPRAAADHSSWNLDLFIDIFPKMSLEQIKALKNSRNNAFTIQLSKKCTKKCLHCAAPTVNRKRSTIDHMPLPVVLKIINKINKTRDFPEEYLKVHLYDHSDISDYFDPVLKSNILPILDFARTLKIDASSLTNGAINDNKLFDQYLPELISFHPFHQDIFKYVQKMIISTEHSTSVQEEERSQIIKKYLAKFLNTIRLIKERNKNTATYQIYKSSEDSPIIYVKRFYLDEKERKILKKDANGNKVIQVIDEMLNIQNEIFHQFTKKIKQENSDNFILEASDALIFNGSLAYMAKKLGASHETINELDKNKTTALYGELIYVIESDGMISAITPEIFLKDTHTTPYQTLKDTFKSHDSEDFNRFLLILQILENKGITEEIRKGDDFQLLESVRGKRKLKLLSKDDMNPDSRNYVNFINKFILSNSDIKRALYENTPESRFYIYDTLRQMPVPMQLELFESMIYFLPMGNKTINFGEMKANPFRSRRAFSFDQWGRGFDLVPNFRPTIENSYSNCKTSV